MKYADEMGSGAVIYVPSFINIGSGIQKLMGGGIHRQHGDRISLLLFFKNKESGLKLSLKEEGWEVGDWINLAQDRDQWRALVDTPIYASGPQPLGFKSVN
jgi:hypothetical protein